MLFARFIPDLHACADRQRKIYGQAAGLEIGDIMTENEFRSLTKSYVYLDGATGSVRLNMLHRNVF